jgi:hypothetical protein
MILKRGRGVDGFREKEGNDGWFEREGGKK